MLYQIEYNEIALFNSFIKKWHLVKKLGFSSSIRCYITTKYDLWCKSRIIHIKHMMSRAKQVTTSLQLMCAIDLENKFECWDAKSFDEIKFKWINKGEILVNEITILYDQIICAIAVDNQLFCFDHREIIFDLNYLKTLTTSLSKEDLVKSMYVNKNQMCIITLDGHLVCLNIPKLNNIALVPDKITKMKVNFTSINK